MHKRYSLSTERCNIHPATPGRRILRRPAPRVSPLVPITAGLLLAASPVTGQNPSSDTATARQDTATAIPLDPINVTVSKLPLRPSQAGFSVTVVPELSLRAERPRYAVEALRELPGAFVDEATGPGGPAIIRLRGGEEVFTQILMDGVQVNENGGYFDFQGVTLTNVERVEVARGPQSALYGSSAVSGAVQFITAPGQRGSLRLGGLLEGGGGIDQGRSYRGNIVARGGTSNLLYSAGAGLAYNRGIYAVPHDTWTRDGSLRIDATPADRLQVTATARYIDIDTHHPVRDPGVTRVPLDPNARLERDRYVASALARFEPSERWAHGLELEGFRHDFTYVDEHDGITQPPEFFVVDANLTATNDVRRVAAEYLGSYASGPSASTARFAVAYGARWEREDLHTGLTGDFGDSEADFDRDSYAAFADIRSQPHSRVDILVGSRVEHYEGIGTEVTPRGSVVFRAIPGFFSLRAAAGRAYKAPNLRVQFQDDPFIAPNPELEPETSVSWEFGADLEVGRRLTVSATAFRQDYRNLIRTVPLEDGSRLQSRNVGTSRAWGVEAAARYRLSGNVLAGLEATRTWTDVLDNTGLPPEQYPEREELPFRPRFIGNAYLHGGLSSRLEVVSRATYVGRQVVLTERFSGDRAAIAGYLRVDGTVSYDLGERRSVYLRVTNVLDADYQTAYDRPGVPLTLALGVAADP